MKTMIIKDKLVVLNFVKTIKKYKREGIVGLEIEFIDNHNPIYIEVEIDTRKTEESYYYYLIYRYPEKIKQIFSSNLELSDINNQLLETEKERDEYLEKNTKEKELWHNIRPDIRSNIDKFVGKILHLKRQIRINIDKLSSLDEDYLLDIKIVDKEIDNIFEYLKDEIEKIEVIKIG